MRGLHDPTRIMAVVGGLAVAGLFPQTASASGGSYAFSFGYISSPSYRNCAPVVVSQPTYVSPCNPVRVVRHGDYYAYPTGVVYSASSACAYPGGGVVVPATPVVVTPPVRRGGRGWSVCVGGSYRDGPRYAKRTVRHHRRSIRRVYATPAVVRGRDYYRSDSHRPHRSVRSRSPRLMRVPRYRR